MSDPNVAPVPDVPVVPAPAAPAPSPDSQVPAQRSLADAQVVVPAVPPAPQGMQTQQPTVPQTPQAPQQVVSPDDLAKAEQRVKDTQRFAHEKSAEAAKLKTQLNTILNHPLLGPVVQSALNPGTPNTPAQDELKAAFEAYQKAPDDFQAFQILVASAKSSMAKDLEAKERERVTAARVQKRTELVATAINESVASKAPDVPLELFWAMSTKAEAETPLHLVTTADKLEWQIERSIQLARDVMKPRQQAAVAAATQVQQVQRQGQVVMAPGSTTASGPGASAGARTFADAIKEAQARKVT